MSTRICSLMLSAISLAAATTASGQAATADPNLVYLNVCALNESLERGLSHYAAWYNKTTHDTLVGGEKLHERFRTGYAPAQSWYASNEVMIYGAGEYTKYGLPRQVPTMDLKRAGRMGGVLTFVEKSDTSALPEVLYLPVRPSGYCVFQPYQLSPPESLHSRARSAVSAEEFAEALKILERPSMRRHTPSRILLGQMYAGGFGVTADTSAAKRFFQQAIDLGDANGYVALGLFARQHDQTSTAIAHFRTAHERGSGVGSAWVGDSHARAGEYAEALRYLRIASTRLVGDYEVRGTVETAIARLWENPQNVRRDLAGDASAEREGDEQAAEEGDAVAQYLMGRRYELGLAVERSLARAKEYYEMSARRGFKPGLDAFQRTANTGW